jgi:hypothetical protein
VRRSPRASLCAALMAIGCAATATAAAPPLRPNLAGHSSLDGRLAAAAHAPAAHRKALLRHLALRRATARLAGGRPASGGDAAAWPTVRLRRENARLGRLVARRPRRAEPGVPAELEAIAHCESGGNPRAVGGGGTYRGKYQFDRGTWTALGGRGDPAAASEAEQDRRAARLYARAGAAPWPVCGR